ncbi:MAG: SxtJ family membrane protein [Bacteroidetes bacterium]|nr:SxtJ family membrane protein [Bacteroidota bacterium]
MILEEIKEIKESQKDLRKFGLTIGIALIVIAALLLITRKNSAMYFGAAGFILAALGLAVPQILKPLNKIWMSLSIILGWFMTRVILTILFYIAITPIGLLTKLFRKDFLELKIDKAKTSYWQKRHRKKFDPVDYERQF